jgi:hypothetical protein
LGMIECWLAANAKVAKVQGWMWGAKCRGMVADEQDKTGDWCVGMMAGRMMMMVRVSESWAKIESTRLDSQGWGAKCWSKLTHKAEAHFAFTSKPSQKWGRDPGTGENTRRFLGDCLSAAALFFFSMELRACVGICISLWKN